jgi:LPS sulfotransferase NodH
VKLFEEPPQLRRIAAFVGCEFPIASEQVAYAQLDALAAQIGGIHRCVHMVVADPSEQPSVLRHRYGQGLLVLETPQMQCNDAEHLRATAPDRFDPLVRGLADTMGISVPSMACQRDLQTACSGTRWLRGWSTDLIVAVGLSQFGLQSLVASQLLDVPRLMILDRVPLDSPAIALLPMYIAQADWVLVPDEQIRDGLLAHLGATLGSKVSVVGDNQNLVPPPLLTAIQDRLGQPRTAAQPSLGIAAAFVTRKLEDTSETGSTTPLLVLGTERTGSNLLVNLLGDHPQLQLANELFNPRMILNNQLAWRSESTLPEAELLRLRHASPAGLLDALLQEGRDQGVRYAGFKLLYYHAMIDDRVLDMLVAHKDMRIVHLTRIQRLERFASYLRARESDEWYSQSHEQQPTPGPMTIDLRELAIDFVQTSQFEQRYRAVLQHHQVLELDYQDMNTDMVATLQRVCDWLGIERASLTSKSRKTGSRSVQDSIANWQEVCNALAGTCWSHLTETES